MIVSNSLKEQGKIGTHLGVFDKDTQAQGVITVPGSTTISLNSGTNASVTAYSSATYGLIDSITFTTGAVAWGSGTLTIANENTGETILSVGSSAGLRWHPRAQVQNSTGGAQVYFDTFAVANSRISAALASLAGSGCTGAVYVTMK